MYDKLWSAVAAILGVRYDAMTADEMIASLPPDSVGVIAFQNVARMRQTQDIILRQGRKRFGPPTPEVEAAVRGITKLDRLEPLTDRILDVGSWDELLAQP